MKIYDTMLNFHTLPVPKTDCRTHYEGSIDKTGKNADWDWSLYQDAQGEWVLFEHFGPGCIYNFVQHRYPDCPEPEFRFYFDGESSPRFTIRHSQFGEKYPFVEPLASRYIGPIDHGRGPIRVVRSFLPMPFAVSVKITSTVKLEGCDRTKGEGGWGHVIFRQFESPENISTFQPEETPVLNSLTALWKNAGSCIHRLTAPRRQRTGPLELPPGRQIPLFTLRQAGAIAGLRFLISEFNRLDLADLILTAVWDDHSRPDLEVPFGCLFSNELGYHSVRYLLSGMDTDGYFYNYYPMPFSHNCRLYLKNQGSRTVSFLFSEILWTKEWNSFYRENGFLYFRNTPYAVRKHTEGADSIIGRARGSGHIVSSVITAFGETPDSRADCEGDVRVYLDGIRTPQIESDGSESYSCYGWGFETPQEYNPASGYDGHEHKDWSMHRSLMGDWYPFYQEFIFGVESGGANDLYMEHSGTVFYYGRDEALIRPAGILDLGLPESLRQFQYSCPGSWTPAAQTFYFEGDDDHIPVTLTGNYSSRERSFLVTLPEPCCGLILRRVSDQGLGRQKALVYVDETAIDISLWYCPDTNCHKRWLEDEFWIPGSYLKGKTSVRIRIVPIAADPSDTSVFWNDFGYRFYYKPENA